MFQREYAQIRLLRGKLHDLGQLEQVGEIIQLQDEIRAEIEMLKARLPANRPLTQPGPGGSTSQRNRDDGGFRDMGELMYALYKKSRGEGFDARLEPLMIRAAVGSTVPAEGGFAIPSMFVDRALGEELEDTVLLQLCLRQPMTTLTMNWPAFKDDNHSTTAPFGITWAMIPEGGSFGSLQGTPFRSLQLEAKKAGAIFAVRNEWLADSTSGIRQRLENVWRASLRWFVEDMLWSGTGAGQALGALNGSGGLEIAKEAGQPGDTILTENVVQMWSRLRPGSHNRAIWACNASCFPQLATLNLSVGTGGAPVGLLQTNGSIAGAPATSILGRPLYMSEHLPALGNAGDLVLLDPLAYVLGDRQEIILDVSPHFKFDTDETVFRASARLDGQPVFNVVLTPKNGPTCGWLLKIAERA